METQYKKITPLQIVMLVIGLIGLLNLLRLMPNHHYDDAIDIIPGCAPSADRKAEELMQEARQHIRLEEFNDAYHLLEDAKRYAPKNVSVLFEHAHLAMLLNRNEAFLDSMIKAYDASPKKDTALLNNLTLAYIENRKYQLAVDHATEAIAGNEQSHKSYFFRGLAYRGLNALPQALRDFLKAELLMLSTGNIHGIDELYYELSKTYMDIGDLENAMEYIGKALAENPRNELYHIQERILHNKIQSQNATAIM